MDAWYVIKPVGRGGRFEGIRSNPPFDLQKILYAPLNCTLIVWSISLTAIKNRRYPNESSCTELQEYVSSFTEDQRRTHAYKSFYAAAMKGRT